MSAAEQRLPHARGHGKDQVVFVPPRRRTALLGHMRQALGTIVQAVARQKAWRMSAGHRLPAPVHICMEIPPRYAVAAVIGSLTGKSASAIARQCAGRERNCAGGLLGRGAMRSLRLVVSGSKAAPLSVPKRRPTAPGDLSP